MVCHSKRQVVLPCERSFASNYIFCICIHCKNKFVTWAVMFYDFCSRVSFSVIKSFFKSFLPPWSTLMSITHFAKGMLDTLSTFIYPQVLDRPFILILACTSLFLLWWFLLPFCHDQLLLLLFYPDLLLALRTSKWRRSRFTLRSTRIDIGQIARCVDTQRAQGQRNSTIYRPE